MKQLKIEIIKYFNSNQTISNNLSLYYSLTNIKPGWNLELMILRNRIGNHENY